MLKTSISVRASGKKVGEIAIFDAIGADMWGGISAKIVYNELKELGDTDSLVVRLNSPGGDAAEGVAIYNVLAKDQRTVSVIVEGWAVSAASVVAMAGDTITMSAGSQMMIHNPWTFIAGDAEQLRDRAEALDKTAEGLIDIYSTRVMLPRQTIADMMGAETWFTAQEAVDQGFATHLNEQMPAAAAILHDEIQKHFLHMPATITESVDHNKKRRQSRISHFLAK